jgi:hypothetical protein
MQQTTSYAPVFSKTKVWLGKYWKEVIHFEQCFFKLDVQVGI